MAALDLIPKVAGGVRFFGKPVLRAARPGRLRPAADDRRLGLSGHRPRCRGDGAVPEDRLVLARDPKWKEQARAALEQVGLADMAQRQISQLSGGQQQRVFSPGLWFRERICT